MHTLVEQIIRATSSGGPIGGLMSDNESGTTESDVLDDDDLNLLNSSTIELDDAQKEQ